MRQGGNIGHLRQIRAHPCSPRRTRPTGCQIIAHFRQQVCAGRIDKGDDELCVDHHHGRRRPLESGTFKGRFALRILGNGKILAELVQPLRNAPDLIIATGEGNRSLIIFRRHLGHCALDADKRTRHVKPQIDTCHHQCQNHRQANLDHVLTLRGGNFQQTRFMGPYRYNGPDNGVLGTEPRRNRPHITVSGFN